MSVQSVNRAIDILHLFSRQAPRLGITEISNAMGLSKTTIHGLVKTLTERGFLCQDPDSLKYSLGLNIYELSSNLAGTLKINQVGTPAAQRLSRELNLLVRLAQWDSGTGTMLITQNVIPGVADILTQQLGPRLPAHCNGSGKAVLAALPPKDFEAYLREVRFAALTPNTITSAEALRAEVERARELGYALDREESQKGVACIGAAIRDHTGLPVAGISISDDARILESERLAEYTAKLAEAAGEISLYMGCYQ